MAETFDEKVIICGKHIEHYQYLDMPVLRGYRRRKRIEIKTEEKENSPKEKTAYSVNRTRTEIRRLINSNPQLCKFLTLTFKRNMTNLKKANYFFNIFIQKMQSRFKEFQYLAVVEFQKRGAVHYHLLCNLRYVQSGKIEKIWNNGFIKINRIDRISNLGAYVCKYVQKELFDKRMFRKKKYFCSQTLQRPTEIVGQNAKFFAEKGKENWKLIWENEFENEYRGKVLYKQYQIKN